MKRKAGSQGSQGSQDVVVLTPHPILPLILSPSGGVLLGGTAAGGEHTDAAQDGEQGGAPAQVEGRTQFIPGRVEEVSASSEELSHPRSPRAGLLTHLVPAYRGSKKLVVMFTAYHEIATIPQAPGEKVAGSSPKCPSHAINPPHPAQAREL